MESKEVKAVDYLQAVDQQWLEEVTPVLDSCEQLKILLTYLTILTNDGVIEKSCEPYKKMLQSQLSTGIKNAFDNVDDWILPDRILIYSNYDYLTKCYENLTGHKLYEDK